VQDTCASHDPENLSKGQLLMESYIKFLYDNSLVSSKIVDIDKRIRRNKNLVPFLTVGAGVFASYIVNPLFLSRTARFLRVTTILLISTYMFYRLHVYINALNEEKIINLYIVSPRYVKSYLETKDHRHLLEANFDVNDFDPVTKMVKPGK